MLLLVVLGLVAGVLTTLAGLGGGLLLLVVLGFLRGPHLALALTTPALLAANVHRAWMYRGDIDRRFATAVALGVVPGAIVGGLLLPGLPEVVVAGLFTLSTGFALARSAGWVRLDLRPRWITAYATGIGALAATSGGAGMLIAPMAMSAGLTGTAYIATIATSAVAMHVGRVIGYGATGLLTVAQLPEIAALLVGLLAGNLIGKRLRVHLPRTLESRIELGALVVANAFAIAGVIH